jgi:hypothetical protein
VFVEIFSIFSKKLWLMANIQMASKAGEAEG